MRRRLWDYVSWMLKEASSKEEQEEVSAISTGGGALQSTGAISGVTTPLGTDATYPNSRVGHRKTKKSK